MQTGGKVKAPAELVKVFYDLEGSPGPRVTRHVILGPNSVPTVSQRLATACREQTRST